MSYQDYADHHLIARDAPPENECPTMRRPRAECGCPGCCSSRNRDEGNESEGGGV